MLALIITYPGAFGNLIFVTIYFYIKYFSN